MNKQTFIFVHNQYIILDFLSIKKFNDFDNLKFVFLGDGCVDQIENNNDVIIARNLPHNIEKFKNLTAFTGWWALWKNNLIESDYVSLFEYDILHKSNFNQVIENYLPTNSIIGFVPLSIKNKRYLHWDHFTEPLVHSIKENYDIDCINLIDKLPDDFNISMTSNHTFLVETFIDYMKWMVPILEDIKENPYAGHHFERSISLYYLINEVKFIIIKDIIKHFEMDSHKTSRKPNNRFNLEYNNLLKKHL